MLTNLFKYWTLQLFQPSVLIKEKYHAFQSLLEQDKLAHELMAELEEITYDQRPVDFTAIESRYGRFADAVGCMVSDLERIAPGKYTSLARYRKKFDDYVQHLLGSKAPPTSPPYILSLDDPRAFDVVLTGGKAANLAKAAQLLQMPVPSGFAITTRAFQYFVQFNDLDGLIAENLAQLDIRSADSLNTVSRWITTAIAKATIPPELATAIEEALESFDPDVRLAVRSSAVGEDTRTSFAGQYETVLDVGAGEISSAYKQVLASKYAPAALVYRINYGLTDRETPMAVLVVQMVEAAASGVMYTRTAAGHCSVNAVWGLGQPLVDGESVPAIFEIDQNGLPAIVDRQPHGQRFAQVLAEGKGLTARSLDEDQQGQAPIDDATALALAGWGHQLESHFDGPQDVEWCRTADGQRILLQTRPFHDQPVLAETGRVECTYDPVENEILADGGQTAAGGIAAGTTVHVESVEDLNRMPDGSVVVARSIPPAFAAAVNRMHAVVAEAGSVAGHFASVAREFGIPTIVHLPDALAHLPEGVEVTVNAENATVYRGIIPSMVESPCARRNLLADSPFMNRLGAVMSFISALTLVDPTRPDFTPEGCRSQHDILRFVHEKGVAAMFELSNIRIRKVGGSRKLRIGIPMLFYVIDLGGGIETGGADAAELELKHVASAPLQALFKGLTHPDIQWGSFSHFDWQAHDKAVMSGGSISPDSVMFASHAIVSDSYANLNLRFGYHFVVLDAVCADNAADNHILLRFAGGGADVQSRRLRALFLSHVFKQLGFEVTRTSDLIDARFASADLADTRHRLDMVGRLLGATRLMDMYLKDEAMAGNYAEAFMQGRYHFSSVEL